jgi:hypothetical protein
MPIIWYCHAAVESKDGESSRTQANGTKSVKIEKE